MWYNLIMEKRYCGSGFVFALFAIVPTFFASSVHASSILSPSGLQNQCNAAGNQVTISWNPVSAANFYLLRVNDTSDDSSTAAQWNWYNPGTTDINNDNVPQATYTTPVIPGHPYTWWVHSYVSSSSSASDPSFGNFICNAPPPAPPVAPAGLSYQCNAAGNQVTMNWNPVSGVDFYILRLNDSSNDSSSSAQWNWYVPGTTDLMADHVLQTTYSAPVIAGKNYIWWVQSYVSAIASSSAATFGGFTCTAQSSNPTTINVKDYGAKGDGITDDAPAIQLAVDHAGSGSTVYIPAGTYMLGTSAGTISHYDYAQQTGIWIKASHITLKGDGSSTILKLMPHKKMEIIGIAADYITIDGIVADGNGSQRDQSTGYPNGDVVAGLVTSESYRQHNTFQNCEVRNGLETGIGFWQNSYDLVQNCYIHDNGTSIAGGSGIDMSGGVNNKAIKNRIIGNTYGIIASFGDDGNEIRNNVVQNSMRTGIGLGGGNPIGGDKNFIVDGNTISGSGWAAIGMSYVLGASITNNTVTNNSADGIQVYDYDAVTGTHPTDWSTNLDIENNVCSNNMFGMRMIAGSTDGPKNITIKHNTCQNNGTGLADQIIVYPTAQVNSDWKTANTLSYGNTTTPACLIRGCAAPPQGCTYVGAGACVNGVVSCGTLSCNLVTAPTSTTPLPPPPSPPMPPVAPVPPTAPIVPITSPVSLGVTGSVSANNTSSIQDAQTELAQLLTLLLQLLQQAAAKGLMSQSQINAILSSLH